MIIMTNNFLKSLVVITLVTILCTTGLSLLPDVRADCPAGMISYWKLDETSGTTAADSFNGNTGTVSGAIWTSSGKVNSALSFDGIDDNVQIPDSPSLHLSSFTVMVWAQAVAKFGAWRTILTKDNADQSEFWFGYADNNKLDFKFNGQGGNNINGPSQKIITDSGWHFLVGVYDGSNIMVYVDGVLDGSKVYGPMTVGTGTVNMGITRFWGDNCFQGVLDEVATFNIALTSTEIMSLYSRGLAGHGYCNVPPTAGFTYSPISPTDLDGIQFTDQSIDSDGTITSWSWGFGDGSTSVLQNPTHTYADDGTYHVTLTVTDNDGASSNSVSKDVIVSNVPPVADAGGPYFGSKGETIIFDASNSKDIDGYIVSYTWDFGDGNKGSGSIIGHQYNSIGNYVASLTIKDDDAANDSDTAMVYIITGNLPPYTPKNPHPENNAVDVPINTFLSWTGGDPDVGDIVTYDVYFGSMLPLQKVASNISTPSYNPGTLANRLTYYWKIVAWDNHGFSADGPVWIFTTINATNSPPNKPSKPLGPTTGIVGTAYTYTTSTTDPDGDNVRYGWDGGDGVVDFWTGNYSSGSTCAVNIKFLGAGTYYLQVKAKDTHGAQSNFSQQLTVVITGANNPPYTPITPTGPTSGVKGIPYSYSTTTTDPDADKIEYGWDWNGDGTVDEWTSLYTSGVNVSTSHTFTNTGIFNIKVIAEDEHGAQSSFSSALSVTITNNPPNKPSKPSGSTSGKSGVSYSYQTLTTDPDGDQIYYMWAWADGTPLTWIGPYSSGQTVTASHLWSAKGIFSVKVKAKDSTGAESVWSDPLPITMPYSFNRPLLQFLEWLFQRFPHAFPVMRQLLGY